MNRRAFLKTAAAATLSLSPTAGGAKGTKDKPDDAAILAQCRPRIEEHRQARVTLVLSDAGGRPVSRGTVRVEQTRHDFLFGCNFFMFGRHDDPGREEAYRAQFQALLNYGTLGFYWAGYERERGKPNYDYTDRVLEFCARHGIRCKGHPLVWDHPAGSPAWLPDDFNQIAELSRTRVREIISRFRGRIDIWDVVNEAAHLPDKVNATKMARWGASVGANRYTVEALKVARTANPAASLLVNDYRTGPEYRKLVEGLRSEGRMLCDAIGIQSHMHDGAWPLHKVWNICDIYGAFGVPVHFTEATVVSGPRLAPGEHWGATSGEGEAQQAEAAARFYTALFAHPAVQAITWWDFSDRGAWQGAAAGLLRKDQSPKPAYVRLLDLIKGQWWTRAEAQPDPQGHVSLRAFHGTHRVKVTLPSGLSVNREIHVQRDKANRFELQVS